MPNRLSRRRILTLLAGTLACTACIPTSQVGVPYAVAPTQTPTSGTIGVLPSPTPRLSRDTSSPARHRIAFVGQQDVRFGFSGHSALWVMQGDGSGAIKVLERPDTWLRPAAWLPNGSQLLVIEEGDLVLVDLPTGERHKLYVVPRPTIPAIHAVFPSPEGSRIAFMISCCGGDNPTLYLLSVEGGDAVQLPVPGHLLGWNAAGTQLQFIRAGTIVTLDPVTKQTTELKAIPARQGAADLAANPWQSFALAPDGRRGVYLIYPQPDTATTWPRTDLVVLDLAGGTSTNLTNGFAFHVDHPCWSPDSAWIAFTASMTGESLAAHDLWISAGDGSVKRNLTNGTYESITTAAIWSPREYHNGQRNDHSGNWGAVSLPSGWHRSSSRCAHRLGSPVRLVATTSNKVMITNTV